MNVNFVALVKTIGWFIVVITALVIVFIWPFFFMGLFLFGFLGFMLFMMASDIYSYYDKKSKVKSRLKKR